MKYVNRPHLSLPFFPSFNRIKVLKNLNGQSYTKKWENLRKRITRFTADSSQYVLVVNNC